MHLASLYNYKSASIQKEIWGADQRASEAEDRLPRFLFRGFHSASGGLQLNTELNSKKGITPHAFLEHQIRHPDVIPKMKDVRSAAITHIRGMILADAPSPLSSWAADFETAITFARAQFMGGAGWIDLPEPLNGSIAILDTHHFLPAHERGPAYRSVRIADIRAKLQCQSWPRCVSRRGMEAPHEPTLDQSVDAMMVGNLFASACSHEESTNIEIALAVFAAELSRYQHDAPLPKPRGNRREEGKTIEWGQGQVELMYGVLLLCGGAEVGTLSRQLANPHTPNLGFAQLQLMTQLLSHVTSMNSRKHPDNPTRFNARAERAFQREVFRIMDSEEFKSRWGEGNVYEHRCDKKKKKSGVLRVFEAEVSVPGQAMAHGPLLTPSSWEATSMHKRRRLG